MSGRTLYFMQKREEVQVLSDHLLFRQKYYELYKIDGVYFRLKIQSLSEKKCNPLSHDAFQDCKRRLALNIFSLSHIVIYVCALSTANHFKIRIFA